MTCTPVSNSLVPFVSDTLLFALISLTVAFYAAYLNGRKGGVNFWTHTLVVAILVCEVCAISISIELRAWDNYDWGLFTAPLSLAIFVLIAALPVGLTLTTVEDHKKEQQGAAHAEPVATHV
ncbi:MAG TPA: hypothetical protein VFO38_04715 [Candidatus Saccharimonadales bacterium]|nr:hypothetical protein [Candidatus Saccharimonadales bacterium]